MKKKEIKKENKNNKKQNSDKQDKKKEQIALVQQVVSPKKSNAFVQGILLPQKVVQQIADEVAKRMKRGDGEKKAENKPKIESPLFLDTSAIIDTRLFDLVKLGVFYGNFIVLESVLAELKNIADSKDDVKKERGRRALKYLDEIKKQKDVKLVIIKDEGKEKAVDDKIVDQAKKYKGRIITCDYNLSQKAKISGVTSIDIYEMANILKTQAVPGETFWIKVIQKGKGDEQGVGYLPDGTMIVVEKGEIYIGKTVKVTISRIIQTDVGKILFAKTREEVV